MLRNVIIAVTIILPSTSWSAPELSWKHLYKKEGIDVFSANITGSNFVAFKGKVTLPTNPKTLIGIFKDETRWNEWTNLLITGKILPSLENSNLIFYQAFKSPPFIANRDAVYKVAIEGPDKEGAFRVTGQSVTHPQSPPTIGVRMHIEYSRWVLTPDRHTTMVELEMHADPGGLIPAWVVNLVQRKYPFKVLDSLRKFTARIVSEKPRP